MKPSLTFLCLAVFAAAAQDNFNWRGNVAAGKAIEIKGVNGGIHAGRSMTGAVEVTATKSARRDNPSDVRVDVVEHEGGVTICAVYPGDGNRCGRGKEGKMNVRNNDVQVEFTVKVPAGVNLIARSVNGDVEAKDIQGDVNAHTVNGKVSATASGVVEGHTVNGDIDVTMGSANAKSLEFHTVNGSIDIAMPQGTGAEMDAHTVNGKIESDLPMQVSGNLSPRHVKAKLGNGGPALNLHTVNGSVRIRNGR
jgi:hypothetical protein